VIAKVLESRLVRRRKSTAACVAHKPNSEALDVQVTTPQDILNADRLIFPGVGAFGQAMEILNQRGFSEPLKEYITDNRPFLGICIGMQVLFDGSEEDGGSKGLSVVPGTVSRFQTMPGFPVPHIGWNELHQVYVRNSTLILHDSWDNN